MLGWNVLGLVLLPCMCSVIGWGCSGRVWPWLERSSGSYGNSLQPVQILSLREEWTSLLLYGLIHKTEQKPSDMMLPGGDIWQLKHYYFSVKIQKQRKYSLELNDTILFHLCFYYWSVVDVQYYEFQVHNKHSVISCNFISRLVITFLPRSKRLLISGLQSPSAVILEPPKITSDTASTVSPSICHEVMRPDAMILGYWLDLTISHITILLNFLA